MTRREFAVALFLLAALCGAACFIFGYVDGGSRLCEGAGLFIAAAALCAAALGWAFWIVPYEQTVDNVAVPPSSALERELQKRDASGGSERRLPQPRAYGATRRGSWQLGSRARRSDPLARNES